MRDEKYPVDGPAAAGAGHALGAGCAWLWSCGGAWRPVVRRYLWRGLRSDNYRSDTTIAVRSSGVRSPGRDPCVGRFVPWDNIGTSLKSPGTPGAFFYVGGEGGASSKPEGRPVACRAGARCSRNPSTTSPQGEKSTASQDQARQSGTDDGAWDWNTEGKQLGSKLSTKKIELWMLK